MTVTPTPTPRLLRNAALVFAGGAVGAGLRFALTSLAPLGSMWTTLAINLVGAFALGVLTAIALRRGTEQLRLLLGTGLLGGFTTYSSFAFDVSALAAYGDLAWIVLAVASLFVGFAFAALGWRLGSA
ncbi:fluoride efflux transporter FluC [Gulosibacter sp. ACHW.36C]|uniref:Fluoride-specific ion channel FluC n=1 Tax=Gulosibacter sediminis TaxID=1729695 RepID=A0ABY4N0N6_9MICO|nr:CrcB family protein [Gulosibacter sediminis]UQN15007.1 CrcB family protein [Gulosibacter sediminis]